MQLLTGCQCAELPISVAMLKHFNFKQRGSQLLADILSISDMCMFLLVLNLILFVFFWFTHHCILVTPLWLAGLYAG